MLDSQGIQGVLEPGSKGKAEIFKMPGVRVDGNNVVEVYKVANRAVENARRGKGPALIECMTYRWRGHVGPNFDFDKGLRSKEELDYWIDNKGFWTSTVKCIMRPNITDLKT